MDRFTRGFIAGLNGGVVMDTWSFISYYFDLTEMRFVDWMSIILYGDLAANSLEVAFALAAHLVFVGILGIGFAYLVPLVTSKNYLLKAILYSLSIGFIVYAIPTMFKTPHLSNIALKTVISNYFGATLWAITLAFVLKYLDKNVEV